MLFVIFFSSSKRLFFLSIPAAYPTSLPLEPITLWHGIIIVILLFAIALATCLIAFGSLIILEIFLLEFTTNTLLELAVPGVTIVLFNSVDVELTCWLFRVNVFILVVKVL